ncbi:MAG: DUF473 family protein [archaeon]
MFALFAISWPEMQDLRRLKIKTFELTCTDHVITSQKIKKGDSIFITNVSKADISKGTEGIIGQVVNVKTDYWRTVPEEFDEKEVLTTRIQIKYINVGIVKKFKDLGPGFGIEVEVEPFYVLE